MKNEMTTVKSKMTNEQYVNSLGIEDKEIQQKVLDVLKKYGDNKWWLSEESKVIGYYQLNEPTLLVNFGKFHEGTESLLGRPVWTHEFGINLESLKKEAESAWNELRNHVAEKRGSTLEKEVNGERIK